MGKVKYFKIVLDKSVYSAILRVAKAIKPYHNERGNMKYHTIKSERYNTRENGRYASYPVYNHETGIQEYILECYSDCVDLRIKALNNGDTRGFFKYSEV